MARRSLIFGLSVGAVSLGAAGWSAAQHADAMSLAASRPAQAVPPPREFVPPGTRVSGVPTPLTASQRQRLSAAIWRDPLDQRLFNYLYVDKIRTAGAGAASLPAARALARLGWRYTPAQQNLMLRSAVDGRFGDVIDRADALLRRQKLTDQAITMLVAMEAIPQVHQTVVDKLLGDPMWRHDYLVRIGARAPTQILDARLDTMRVLLRTPDDVSRAELAPTLEALFANGRGRDAYQLWARKAGPRRAGNALRDGNFREAVSLTGDELRVPFEWRLNQNLGFSTNAEGRGVVINWDGRGVPVFMTQVVPVLPGRRYAATIRGRSDSGELSQLLSPSLICGQVTVTFDAVAGGAGGARFQSAPVPARCDVAVFALNGAVDAGRRAASMDIGQIVLRPTQ